jgi:hypothetical protein
MATVLLNDRIMLDQIHVTIRINRDIPHKGVSRYEGADVDAQLVTFKEDVRQALISGLHDLPEPPPEWGVIIEVEE